ncbi:MAG: GGDEF domain-containing protein [Pirellulales bacterium]
MVALVLFVAIVNIGLGVALAELWSRGRAEPALLPPRSVVASRYPPVAQPMAAMPVSPPIAEESEGHDSPVPDSSEDLSTFLPELAENPPRTLEVDASAVESRSHDIPAEWLSILGSIGPVNSFIEAAIEVLKLQVGEYRDQLVEIDRQVRGLTAESGDIARAACLGVLREVNQEWSEQQRAALRHLRDHQAASREYAPQGLSLIDILERQAGQIESMFRDTAGLTFAPDLEGDRQSMLHELGLLLDLAHELRDSMQECAVQVLRREERLEALDKARLSDEQTGLQNRLALEGIFHQWWRNDPSRQRRLCVAMLDIDGFVDLNLRHGWATGDRMLRGIGALIQDMVRKSRGFDRVGRVAGQRFLFFFGETGPRGAQCAIERIRQSLAATTFEDRDSDLQITCSCGVLEVGPTESTDEIVARLNDTLAAARRQGGNRTAIDNGSGPIMVDAVPVKVAARIVRLRD